MGNDAKPTKDGSRYAGVGFIQLTGKSKYGRVSEAWNKKYPDDKKDFQTEADGDLLSTDVEVALKASLAVWGFQKINDKADAGITNDEIDDVGREVNGTVDDLPNGYEHRRTFTKKAYKALNDDD